MKINIFSKKFIIFFTLITLIETIFIYQSNIWNVQKANALVTSYQFENSPNGTCKKNDYSSYITTTLISSWSNCKNRDRVRITSNSEVTLLLGYLDNGGYSNDTLVTGQATGNEITLKSKKSANGYIKLVEINPLNRTIIQILDVQSISISADTNTTITNLSSLSGIIAAGNTFGILISIIPKRSSRVETSWGSYENKNKQILINVDEIELSPRITSLSKNNEQIGKNIIISGEHFGTSPGTVTVNTQIATIINWNNNTITIRIPGQEGLTNTNGKIQITRLNDGKVSNFYPVDPSNFTILAPSISSSSPSLSTNNQNMLSIQFFGLGIDTEVGISPVLKLSKLGESDIIGTEYLKITDYQSVQATFDLTGVAVGDWDLVITNMDKQVGVCNACFTISSSTPIVTGVNPGSGINSETININSITGNNFQPGAIAKLTKTAQTDTVPTTPFTFTNSNILSNGIFDLTGKTIGWWNVVVINSDLQSGSYGNEINKGFEIKSVKPSPPTNIYQFKNNTDSAQPPTTEISAGDGIGGQVKIYFRMDMEGGLTEDIYYPQIEIKPIGAVFDETFIEGSGIIYNGTPVQGWVIINGIDNNSYHWRARVRNSMGLSDWISFGSNADPNDIDLYIDNTPPSISPGTNGTCASATINIMDMQTTIIWNTSDLDSGSQIPPGQGAYASAQLEYTKTSSFIDWNTTPGTLSALNPRENSPHQITLLNLSPNTTYTYRMISEDAVQNKSFYENCTFTTTSSRPIKTIELFILQENSQNTGTRIKKDFNVSLPESPGDDISVKSAFIEITGISGDGNQVINVELRRGLNQNYIPSGSNYIIDSNNTTTPFTILFNTLNPPGTGQESMKNIIAGATNYNYTLFLNGTSIPTSSFSAKLIITYSYLP